MSNPQREITAPAEIRAIVERHQVCRIALNDDAWPYVVPVNFGYDYQDGRWVFYFHGARTGKKMRLLRKNPAVSVEIDGDHGLITADDACDYGFAYTSIMATGYASILQSREEMQRGLDAIMRQSAPGKTFRYREQMMKAVCVVRIDCETLTCHRHSLPG